jgi:hypothetical protein
MADDKIKILLPKPSYFSQGGGISASHGVIPCTSSKGPFPRPAGAILRPTSTMVWASPGGQLHPSREDVIGREVGKAHVVGQAPPLPTRCPFRERAMWFGAPRTVGCSKPLPFPEPRDSPL